MMLAGPGPVLTYRPLENAAQVIISEVIICAEMSEVDGADVETSADHFDSPTFAASVLHCPFATC